MQTVFKYADLLHHTGATNNQLDYWLTQQLTVPTKDAAGSGAHREFAILSVIEFAQVRWLITKVGMSTDRIKPVLAAQRKTLAHVPPEQHAVQVWMQFVHMVLASAPLIGITEDPSFQQWRGEVEIVLRRLRKRPVATDAQLLDLLSAQRAALHSDHRPHA